MFKNAVLRGIAASPFASTRARPLYLLIGTTRTPLVGASVRVRDNQAKAEEYGLDRKQEITARIPKNLLTAAPRRTLDKLEYASRIYDIDSVTGDADHAACWLVKGSCPTP
jgi:hypothetical protein